MQFAKRIEKLPAYLFAEISKKIAEKRAQGVDVISFGIGDPDLATPDHLLDALQTASRDPANHRYPESEGLPELRQSIARWYQRRFGVEVEGAHGRFRRNCSRMIAAAAASASAAPSASASVVV